MAVGHIIAVKNLPAERMDAPVVVSIFLLTVFFGFNTRVVRAFTPFPVNIQTYAQQEITMTNTRDVTAQHAGLQTFRHVIFKGAQALDWLSAAAIVGMMALTCADVTMRLFRRPITGTYEVVTFLGALAVAFALAHTSVEKGHVAVDLLVRLLPKRIQGVVAVIITLLSLALFALITWQTVRYGLSSQRAGEVSLTLQFPLYPIIYGVAFGTGAVCLTCLADLVDALEKIGAAPALTTPDALGRKNA